MSLSAGGSLRRSLSQPGGHAGLAKPCGPRRQEWEHVYCAAVVAANTSMRPVEVKHLRRRDVDLVKKLLFVRRSKNESSHRVIPLNVSALNALARMFERADQLGHTLDVNQNVYTQASVARRKRAVDALESALPVN